MMKNIDRIYIIGNPLLASDSLPLKIIDGLKAEFPRIQFEEIDPSENLPEMEELVLIDTAADTDDVRVLEDIERIIAEPRYSLHDFGLGTHLKLLKKVGRLRRVAIICIPQKM